MKKISLLILSVAWTIASSAAPFHDGDTVVFFGDSITHGGLYHEYLTDFYLTRYPEAKIRFVNSGIGGDTADGALPRVKVDVAEYKPTCVCFHFGMNDINRGLYTATPDAQALEGADAAQKAYRANLDKLVAAVREAAPKARHVYLTPTIYDDTAVPTNIPPDATGWAVVNQVGCNAGLALMAGHVLAAAKRDGALAVNWYTPLENFLMARRAHDPHFMITRWDRVHPEALGHSIMAWEFLRAQGVDPVVSEVTVDAVKGAVTKANNVTVSELAKRDGGVAFTMLAKALPFPVAPEAKGVLAEFKVAETLNRETVCVTGLADGEYELTIDGNAIGRWSAAELAQGVNLGFNEKTPQYAQAQRVFARTAELSVRERVLRNHHSARWFYTFRGAPVDDAAAFKDWFEKNERNKTGYFAKFVPGYLDYWPHYRETRAELLKDQEDVRRLAKPVAHRYVLARAAQPTDIRGFYRVEKASDGRWWAVDPQGMRTVVRGVDWVIYRGHGCEVDGKAHHYREWNDAHYASPADWERETLGRLKDWGFTMLGTGHDATLRHRGFAHAWEINFGNKFGKALDEDDERWIMPGRCAPCTALPNVFHPDFPAYCAKLAVETCGPMKEDHDLLGWFLDNELCWWGAAGQANGATGVWKACLAKPASHSARKAAVAFAGAHPELKDAALHEAFLTEVADRYFAITVAAVKKVDPNHMILGCRFAGLGGAPECVWKVAGKYADVVTFNCYPSADLDRNVLVEHIGGKRIADLFRQRYEAVGRPMLVTEWSFPALDSGLPCTNGAGQRFRTQAERTQATELCAKTFLALPFLIGYDYFMWVDEPKNGISKLFPENTNYGLVSEKGVPYPIADMFRRLHADVTKWHDAPLPAERTNALELVAVEGAGDALRDVKLDGVRYGSFRVMLMSRQDGVVRWSPATRVTRVKRTDDRIDLTAEGEDEGVGFAVDLAFEKASDLGAFVASATRVANRGKKPFTFMGLVFGAVAEFVKGPGDAPPDRVPQLWKAPKASAWRAKDGRVYAARSDSPLCEKVEHFWFKPENRAHPDAVFHNPKEVDLGAGASLSLSPHYHLNLHLSNESVK